MQLVSNEFLESQAAVAYTDSDGKLRMGFSTDRKPVDRTTPPREDPNIAPQERLLPDGRVTRTVTSLTTIHELQPFWEILSFTRHSHRKHQTTSV